MISSGSVRASIASCAASSDDSGTTTVSGSSSPSVCSSESMPAEVRIDWISSPSATSPAIATCTMRVMRLHLLRGGYVSPRQACAALDELRNAPLLEGDLDQVEVARHDGVGKDRARLALDV